MKNVFLVAGLVIGGAGLFALGWVTREGVGQASAAKPTASNSVASTQTSTPPPPAPHFPLVSPEDFQHLRAARETAFRDNPDLAAEYKQILDDMQAQDAKFDAAMVKANPKVAPIIAKLVALRQRNGGPSSSTMR